MADLFNASIPPPVDDAFFSYIPFFSIRYFAVV